MVNEYGLYFAEKARFVCPLCVHVDEISHCYFPGLSMHAVLFFFFFSPPKEHR